MPSAELSAPEPKRILVIRLDRIGDVVLSTPVLSVLRQRYPNSFIAMMVRTPCRELVEDHSALDKVILYDKDGEHRGIASTIRFARKLSTFHFDTALILHPSNRSHWIPALAGIPVRIGYNRKSGMLLTHRLPHRKQEGSQHEASYSLEMLKVFGIKPPSPTPSLPIQEKAVRRIRDLLSDGRVSEGTRLIAIHPSASCISKRWMPKRFAEVADRLIQEHKAAIVLLAGKGHEAHARETARAMCEPVLDLSGQLGLAETIALLSESQLLISNDSGPVHMAAAVGTPVVDIFGRNQRGLSPLRWGPLGEGHKILHKEVGCVTCLAHNCDINFFCLTSLSTDEVFAVASSMLGNSGNRIHQ